MVNILQAKPLSLSINGEYFFHPDRILACRNIFCWSYIFGHDRTPCEFDKKKKKKERKKPQEAYLVPIRIGYLNDSDAMTIEEES